MSDDEPQSLAVAIGRNCKRIRVELGATQDELARHARKVGLRWTSAKVSDFESARWASPSFETVLAVSLALETMAISTGKDRAVTPADLIGDGGPIQLTKECAVQASALSKVLRGGRWTKARAKPSPPEQLSPEAASEWLEGYAGLMGPQTRLAEPGLAEARLMKRLHLSQEQLERLTKMLWGRSFTEERDQRAGPDTNAQYRGRVARTLQSEIERHLDGDG
jgi:hypothetical protein